MLLAALCLCCVAAAAEGEADITYQNKLPDAAQAALDAAMAAIHQPYTLEYACGFRELAVESGEITVIHAQVRLTATGGLHVAVLRGNQGRWRLCALSCVLPVRDGKQPTVRHQEAWQFSVEYADAAFTFGENNDGEWVLERYEVLGFRDAEPLRVDCFAAPYEMTLEWCDRQLTLSGSYNVDMSTTILDALPLTPGVALNLVSGGDSAMVCNPVRGERLHLRTRPDRKAPSLGKYYTGVVVRLLRGGNKEWAHVSIGGVEGYMMRQYLAMGDKLMTLEPEIPRAYAVPFDWTPYSDGLSDEQIAVLPQGDVTLYGDPSENSERLLNLPTYAEVEILAVVGKDWAHVRYQDRTGYIPLCHLWPGNG